MGAQAGASGDCATQEPRKVKTTKADRRRKRIVECFEKERSIKGVARKLQISPKTVRKVLRGKPLGRTLIDNPKPRVSKLEPYKSVLHRLIVDDGLTAVLALEELRELGYDGGRTLVCNYAQQLRPSSKRKPTTVVEHTPGAEGQVDWSQYTVELGGEQRVVHAFSLVLPWSRYIFLRFASDEQLDTLLRLHDEAFEDIDRVPPLMTYDNMTTVGRHVGAGKIWINPRFEHYAKHTGFEIRLIDPGNPNQHAPVERHFDYVENNCLRRRRFRFDSFEQLQEHARWWCDHVANVRMHGTTRERPVDDWCASVP
jgi:transposase